MMTRKRLIKTFLEILALVVVSISISLFLSIFTARTSDDRIQRELKSYLSSLIEADRYVEIESDLITNNPNIQNMYEAIDDNGDGIGYILDVIINSTDDSSLHVLTAVSHDGSTLVGLRRVGDESNPINLSDDAFNFLYSQMLGNRIPVALATAGDVENVVDSSVSSLEGLNDGIFYAQNLVASDDGYIDYVEIEVNDGIITRVKWDAFNIDTTTKNREEASLEGAYSVSGLPWASQSYNVCHALIDLQNPEYLAMKSDGTTQIIEGVTTNIRSFVNLSWEAIENSRMGFTKDEYLSGAALIITGEEDSIIENYAPLTDEGLIVYSFEDRLSLFEREDGTYMNVRQVVTEDTTYIPTEESEEVSYEEDSDVDSKEDGMSPGSLNAELMDDSVDGIPLSEIRGYIDIYMDSRTEANLISAVNVSYSFLKNYLNWVA